MNLRDEIKHVLALADHGNLHSFAIRAKALLVKIDQQLKHEAKDRADKRRAAVRLLPE